MPVRRFPPYPRKPHSSGQARIKIAGQIYYLGVFGSPESRTEYRRLMTDWEKGIALRPRTKLESQRVSQVIAAYVQHAETYYLDYDGQPSSHQKRISSALAFVHDFYGPRPVEEFDQDALEEVRNEMVRSGYCRSTVNSYVGVIRCAWKWAARKKLIPRDCYADLILLPDLAIHRTTAPESQPVKPVPVDHVLLTLPFLLPPVADMLRLQMLTGMRPGEVLIMRGCDLDRSREIWTDTPGSDRQYGRHKNAWRGHHRVVPLGPQAQEIIRGYLDRPADAYLFSPRDALAVKASRLRQKRRTKLQPSQVKRNAERARRRATKPQARTRYDNQSYPRAVNRAIELLNRSRTCQECKAKPPGSCCASCIASTIPPWHPNQIRHTVSTKIRAEHGPDAARAMLGQKSLKSAEIYAELDMENVAKIMKRSG